MQRAPLMIGIALEPWYCAGRRPDGSRCNRRLADVALPPGGMVHIRCKYCKTLNVRETTHLQATTTVAESMLQASRAG